MSQGDSSNSTSVLKVLPDFIVYNLDGSEFYSKNFSQNSNSYYVHIWGTWCGPCEAEFGDLLGYASKVKDKKALFYLIAVNDELVNVQKFLKKYGQLPENVKILIDRNNLALDKFGTFKVPETFLFDSKNNSKNKYIGPQDWSREIYLTQLQSVTSSI
jgi:thiol-disulfide isomerase/thioredoxin